MRQIFAVVCFFLSLDSIAQKNNSVPEPNYDTTQIERSTNSFKFCDINFPISRNCENEDQSNCCSFSAQVFKEDKELKRGALSCFDGTSLFWHYFETKEILDANFNHQVGQLEPQLKNFKRTKLKCLLAGIIVDAYQYQYEGYSRQLLYKLITAGTINGKHVMAELHSVRKIEGNEDLQPTIKNVISFK